MSSQSLDVLGEWWLPGHEDHKVTGRLRWDVVEGGTLELLGEVRPLELKDNVLPDGSVQKYREPLTKIDQQYPVILGEVDDEGYTLLGSWSLNSRGFRRLREHRERVCERCSRRRLVHRRRRPAGGPGRVRHPSSDDLGGRLWREDNLSAYGR